MRVSNIMTDHQQHISDTDTDEPTSREAALGVAVTRRALVQRSGALAVTSAVGLGAAACSPSLPWQDDPTPTQAPLPTSEQYPTVPYPPETPPERGQLAALTEEEAALVEALTARIMPGSPDDPGAREAGVVTYIDNLLAVSGAFAEKTYHQGPWAQTYEGDQPPATPTPDDVVWVEAEQIQRYGYQSHLTPLEVYQQGAAAVSRFAVERFGGPVAELPEEQQDEIVQALLDNEASGFDDVPFTPDSFFHTLRRHTMEGMFSDPAYGGNRDMAGWKLIGYPGAQRAYLLTEVTTEGTDREPQSLAELSHFHPGRPEDIHEHAPILPVTGSDEDA